VEFAPITAANHYWRWDPGGALSIVLYEPLKCRRFCQRRRTLRRVRAAPAVPTFLLFVTFTGHFGAALTHARIYRDGVFPSRASRWFIRS
jgi:hypothetical protein